MEQRRGRRRAAWTAVTLAAAAVVVAALRTAPDPEPVVVPAVAAPLLSGPARGSLAEDTGLLADAVTVGWGTAADPPVADREVVLAEETPAGRVLLVAGGTAATWLTGPPGAAASALRPRPVLPPGRDRPAALVVGGPGPGALVVVAGARDEVAVSRRLVDDVTGRLARDYRGADARDGVVVLPVQVGDGGPAVRVRVTGSRGTADVPPDWLPAGPPPPWTPDLTALRPSSVAAVPLQVTSAAGTAAASLGADLRLLRPRVLWSGPVVLGGRPAVVTVTLLHMPAGGLLALTDLMPPGASSDGAVGCGTQTAPAGSDPATLTVAVVCVPGSRPDASRWLVVSAPPTAVRAEVRSGSGTVLAAFSLTGGGAVVPLPDGATGVVPLDAAGRPLVPAPVRPSADPFDADAPPR